MFARARRDDCILADERLSERMRLKRIALNDREPLVLNGNCRGVAGDRSDVWPAASACGSTWLPMPPVDPNTISFTLFPLPNRVIPD